MYADVGLKEHYEIFLDTCAKNIDNYNKELLEINSLIKETKDFLIENTSKIEKTGVDISKYPIEWIEEKCSSDNGLFNRVNNLLMKVKDRDNSFILKQLYKYCSLLNKRNDIEYNLKINENAKNLNYKEWLRYVSDYYRTVHKCVLQGYAYQFSYGIGDLLILTYPNKEKRKVLDYAATRKVKAALLEQGKRLWNKKEAAEYAKRGEEYDGVDYRVFNCPRLIYQIEIFNTTCIQGNKKRFERVEHVDKKLKGLTQDEIAEYIETKEDIYYMPCDLRFKLMVLLKKYPAEYIKFYTYRNENYHNRAYYRKNRQRL